MDILPLITENHPETKARGKQSREKRVRQRKDRSGRERISFSLSPWIQFFLKPSILSMAIEKIQLTTGYGGWLSFLVLMLRCRNTACQVARSCPTLWDPIDYCSLPDSSVHGLLQARILERVAKPFSRGSSWSSDRVHISFISCIGRQVLYHQYHLESPEIQCARNQIFCFPPIQALPPTPTPSHSHGLKAGLGNEGLRGGF